MNRRTFLQSTAALVSGLASGGHSANSAKRVSAEQGLEAFRKDSETVTLFLGGDVMTARGIDQILPHPSDPVLYEDYMKSALGYVELAEQASGPIPRNVDFDYIWGDALGVLERARPDFRVVNLETSVTTSDEPWPDKPIHYRMHPKNLPVLPAAGIDCCALANNHVLDWSHAGLEETLDSLREAGIACAGAGRDLDEASAPAEFELPGGGTLRIYSAAGNDSGVPRSWAAREDRPGVQHHGWLDPALTRPLEQRIHDEKKPGDLAVASLHLGNNWGYEIPREQRVFARRLIIAGADVVHGHSSHHARPIEVYEGRPVLYGVGDLINDYEGIPDRHDEFRGELSLLYFVTLDRATGALKRLGMQPMRVFRFRLQHASESEAAWLRDTLDREGRRLGTRVEAGPNNSLELRWEA